MNTRNANSRKGNREVGFAAPRKGKQAYDLNNFEFRFEVMVIPFANSNGKTLSIGRDPYKGNTLVGEFIRTSGREDAKPFFSGHNETFEVRNEDGSWTRSSFIAFQEAMIARHEQVESATYIQMIDKIVVEGGKEKNKGEFDMTYLEGKENLFQTSIEGQFNAAIIDGYSVGFNPGNFDSINPKVIDGVGRFLRKYYVYFNSIRPEPILDPVYKNYRIILADAVVELVFEEMNEMKELLKSAPKVSSIPRSSTVRRSNGFRSFNDLKPKQVMSDINLMLDIKVDEVEVEGEEDNPLA